MKGKRADSNSPCESAAILEHAEDIEDTLIAEAALAEYDNTGNRTRKMEEVVARYL